MVRAVEKVMNELSDGMAQKREKRVRKEICN
jgi:hypothetical protein